VTSSPATGTEERARLAEALQSELDALTERIAILNQSREQLARLVNAIRDEVVQPGQPEPVPPEALGPAARPVARIGPRAGTPSAGARER
jgi:hypothetical protein